MISLVRLTITFITSAILTSTGGLTYMWVTTMTRLVFTGAIHTPSYNIIFHTYLAFLTIDAPKYSPTMADTR